MCQPALSCTAVMLDRKVGGGVPGRQTPALPSRRSCEISRMSQASSRMSQETRHWVLGLWDPDCMNAWSEVRKCMRLSYLGSSKTLYVCITVIKGQGAREISRKVWSESWLGSHSFERDVSCWGLCDYRFEALCDFVAECLVFEL